MRALTTRVSDAAKPQVVGARAHVALAARADHIARAILVRAEKRPAAMHTLRHAGLTGIERLSGARGIARNRLFGRQLRIIVRPVPVADPLPDVAADIVEAIPVSGKLCDRCD